MGFVRLSLMVQGGECYSGLQNPVLWSCSCETCCIMLSAGNRCGFCNKAAAKAVKVSRVKFELSGPMLLPIVLYIRLYRDLPEKQQ
jgi:hypothetical protein